VQKSRRTQLHIWLWLVLVIGMLVGHAPASVACNRERMPAQGAQSCCAKKASPCPCPPDKRERSVQADSYARNDPSPGMGNQGCPCFTPAPRQESTPAPVLTRIQLEFALSALVPFPSLTPITSREVRAGPVYTTLREASAFPSPPRAPPFQA
jgi:hypothetical protein